MSLFWTYSQMLGIRDFSPRGEAAALGFALVQRCYRLGAWCLQSKRFQAFYNLVSFVLAFVLWCMEFYTTDWTKFGVQFRFLTIWGLSLSMGLHVYFGLQRLRGKQTYANALVSAVAVLNMVIVCAYWAALFIFGAQIIPNAYPFVHDFFIHGLSPLLLVGDSCCFSHAYCNYRETLFFLSLFFSLYVFWLEVFLVPHVALPYLFLTFLDRRARFAAYSVFGCFGLGVQSILFLCFGPVTGSNDVDLAQGKGFQYGVSSDLAGALPSSSLEKGAASGEASKQPNSQKKFADGSLGASALSVTSRRLSSLFEQAFSRLKGGIASLRIGRPTGLL